MGWDALRDVSLKQFCKYTTGWCSVLREERPSIKECEKQKPEAIYNLHY